MLEATWESPVFGDTFGGDDPRRLAQADRQLASIASIATPRIIKYIAEGMPEVDEPAVASIVKHEIMPKTLAFGPALAVELDDPARLASLAVAVMLMYWGDQTMDRGDAAMPEAIMLLGRDAPARPARGKSAPERSDEPVVRSRFAALSHIEANIRELARPEDAPFVLACFYDQVLRHEVLIRQLSLDYLASSKAPAFMAEHGTEVAEFSTISAGFPSISSSLYAIYRQHDASLPALSEIYHHAEMTGLLQTCNVIVRLWDELGDWEMDSGAIPSKGVFVINPCNQYDPACIQRFCELAAIHGPKQAAGLQHAFAGFHASAAARQTHSAYILDTLRAHARQTVAGLSPAAQRRFPLYIALCKRVLEIGYVNRIGDIALVED